jgi:hypothetical protein
MRPRRYYRFAVGTVALGALVGAAAPAYATLTTPHIQTRAALTSPKAYAYVVAECGHCGYLVMPKPESTYPSGGTNTLVGINEGPYSTTSTLTATTAGSDNDGTASGSATVDTLHVTLNPGTIDLTGVSATCTASPSGATGAGTVTGGTVAASGANTALPTNAAPNTTVNVPNFGTIVLNEQSTLPDGELSVNAVHVTHVNGQAVSLIIGHAQCGGAPTVQQVPMVSTPVSTGTGAAAMAATGGAVFLRRRNRKNGFDAV